MEKQFWSFYGFPLYARFGLCLDAAAKRDPRLETVRDRFLTLFPMSIQRLIKHLLLPNRFNRSVD